MSFRADLHIHSYFSDGTNSPEEILYLAKNINLSGISITDHDTIDAYTDDLFKLAKSLNIRLIPGVEVSSELNDINVHILGYNFDLSSQKFRDFLKEIQKKRKLRNTQILQKLKEKNIDISEKELYEFATKKNIAQTIIGRVHIARLMYEKGYVPSMQKAFDYYIEDNGPCYVKGYKFSPKQVIDQIQLAKGKAVLAHPNFIKNKIVINKLLELNFDGLEAYYAKLQPSQEKKWVEVAKRHGLIITGGSDYHGEIRPYITLGCSWVDEDRFNHLLK
jgi:predicted metal-dependent phosphoesterase TrpH